VTPRLSSNQEATESVDWLPGTPPPRIARLAGWLLIGVFAGAVLTAVLLRVPETVRCRFTLVPADGADPLRSSVSGVLQGVRVTEGQAVAADDILFEIRSDEVITWQTALHAATEDRRAMEERVRRSEEAHASLLRINEAGREQIAQERDFRTRFRDTVKDFVRRSQELRDLQLISEVELLKARLELAAAEKDLNIAEQSYHKVGLERTQLETERQLQRSDEQAAVEKLKVTAAGLRQRLSGSDSGLLAVRAPYPAVVTSIGQKNTGGVVTPGLELCQLARIEGHPVADLDLPQGGLDRVASGQPARLFFDAFPYQRYGTLPARVEWVSPSAVLSSNRLQFRARAILDRDAFTTPAGPVPVRPGMVGDARIRVGSRTLIEFAFEPLKALRERMGFGGDGR